MIEPKEFINYKNKDYFFITKENIDGKEIYHYLCEEMIDYIIDDDKYESIDINNPPVFSMFISYENNQYNVVEDKKLIKKYIKEFGMEPELIAYDIGLTIDLMTLAAGMGYLYGKFKPFRLDKNTRQEFKEQQKKSLKDLKEKLNVDIDLDRINKKIDKLKLLGFGNEKSSMLGLYHPIFNNILIKKNILEDSSMNKKVGLHETIHYLGGPMVMLKNYFSRALMEGATEGLVVDYFDEGKSSALKFLCNDSKDIKKVNLQYNFTTISGYHPFISLVKQLEYIVGEKSYKSIINGDRDFIKKVEKDIGKKELLKIIGKSSLLYYSRHTSLGKKLEKHGKELELEKSIQDQILNSYFGRKYNEIKSPEEAKEFMNKLRGFETYRTKISYLTRDNEFVRDDTFKKFYEEKYNGLTERFNEDKELKEEYQYKEQEYRELKLTEKEKFPKEDYSLAILSREGEIKGSKNFDLDIYKTKNGGMILSYDGKSIIPFRFPGEEDLIYASLRLKYPDKETSEINEMFLNQVEYDKQKDNVTIMEVEHKETEQMTNSVDESKSLVKVEEKQGFLNKIKNLFRRNNNSEIINKDEARKVEEVKEPKEINDDSSNGFINKWSFDGMSKENQSKFLSRQADKIKQYKEKSKANSEKRKNAKDYNDINKLGLE